VVFKVCVVCITCGLYVLNNNNCLQSTAPPWVKKTKDFYIFWLKCHAWSCFQSLNKLTKKMIQLQNTAYQIIALCRMVFICTLYEIRLTTLPLTLWWKQIKTSCIWCLSFNLILSPPTDIKFIVNILQCFTSINGSKLTPDTPQSRGT